jgi:hypothetical protein
MVTYYPQQGLDHRQHAPGTPAAGAARSPIRARGEHAAGQRPVEQRTALTADGTSPAAPLLVTTFSPVSPKEYLPPLPPFTLRKGRIQRKISM